MILYLSGNLPQLSDPKKEGAFRNKLHSENRPYHRLGTFFYVETIDTMLKIITEKKTLLRRSKTLSETNKITSTSDLKSQDISDTALNSETQDLAVLLSTKNQKSTHLFEED